MWQTCKGATKMPQKNFNKNVRSQNGMPRKCQGGRANYTYIHTYICVCVCVCMHSNLYI